MTRAFKLLLVLVAFAFTAPAQAQNITALTVASCGTVPTPFTSTKPGYFTVDVNGNLCSNASITVGGFAGNGNYGTLTATASTSASTALPAGTSVRITNASSTATVSCTMAAGAATGLVSNIIVPPLSSISRVVGTNDHIACIDQTGSSGSNLVVLEGGAGLGNDTGGGGGSGGGSVTQGTSPWVISGAVTGTFWQTTQPASLASAQVASGAFAVGAGSDGWNVTQGAKADSVCGTSTGTCTEVALIKYLNTQLASLVSGLLTPPIQVLNGASTYNTIAASQTAQALTGGGGGATGDYLSHCIVIPTSTTPGTVTIADNSTSVVVFPGGASSVSNLVPFTIPVGAVSVSGAWKITTVANESVTCVGKFH